MFILDGEPIYVAQIEKRNIPQRLFDDLEYMCAVSFQDGKCYVSGSKGKKEVVYVPAISKTTDKKKKFNFSDYDNYIIRMEEAEEITFVFGEALPETYYFELSFDSGAEPTSIGYHHSGQLTWLGDDCFTTQEGLSVFEPRPDTSYDIIFYCRKGHIIGKVCGYPIFPW